MKNISSFVKSTGLFLGAVLIFLSLLSYTPNDISFLNSTDTTGITNLIGIIGAYLAFGLFFIFGYASYFIPICFVGMSLDKLGLVRFCGIGKSKSVNFISFLFFTVFLSGFLALFPTNESAIFKASGVVGFFLGGFFKKYLAVGAYITLFILMLASGILLFGFFFVDLFRLIKNGCINTVNYFKERIQLRHQEVIHQPRPKKEKRIKEPKPQKEKKKDLPPPEIKVYTPKQDIKEKELDPFEALKGQRQISKTEAKKKIEDLESQDGKVFDPKTYKIPHPSLIKMPPFVDQGQAKEDIQENIKNLESTFADFGVEVKVVSVQRGPVVTMYEVSPESGTKIQKISSLADDIALSMKSSSVRIVAPIPGRGTIGVEIPNLKKQLVFLREVLEEKVFSKAESKLTIVIGKDVSGNPVVADLGDMPHLLIAGATGAGKTVCVNSIIASILFKAKPDEVKFIMVDPKMVELASFAGIPHLIHPIITESKKAFFALNWAVEEMERRYKQLAEAGARNITAYNNKGKNMPYIVVVVDELADLMLVAKESVETTIQRLAQLSRAVGIHLILATQRPSVDVITGVIKANLPSRVSFKVSAKVDSRTILDSMGADKLLGKGDLLFLKPGAIHLIRAQGSFIDDEDITTLTEFVRLQGRPVYEEAIAEGEKKQNLDLGNDDLFEEAVKIVLHTQQASASLLQRRLRVGYTRAARLLDMMEQAEIVGPFRGSKAREILVNPEEYLVEKGWV